MSNITRPDLTVFFDIHHAPAGTAHYERVFSSLLTPKKVTQTPVAPTDGAAIKLSK